MHLLVRGGTSDDQAYGLAVNGRQEVYITGLTESGDFPVKDALQSVKSGGVDVFVSRISAGGDALLYSTFLGGNDYEGATSIALDQDENILITGQTVSTDFPLTNPAQETHGGLSDVFVTKMNPSGQEMVDSTFLGGAADEIGHDIVVDTTGIAYVCGGTESADFPEKNFGPVDALKSTGEVAEGEADAFFAFFDALGFLLFSDHRRVDGYDYLTALLIMSNAYDRFVAATGFTPWGVSVMMYAIRDYSQLVEKQEAETLFHFGDNSQYYYSKGMASSKAGNVILNLSTTATIPPGENGTEDPNPGDGHSDDNAVVYTPLAQIKVTITTPDSIQNGHQLVAYIKVENVTPDVEAKGVKLSIEMPEGGELSKVNYDGCPFPDEECDLGNIPPGGSVEKIIRFKVKAFEDVNDEIAPGYKIELKAGAHGVNTNLDKKASETTVFKLDVHLFVEFLAGDLAVKSTQSEMVDLYVDDVLVADDIQSGVVQEHDVSVNAYPKIDITTSSATDNQDPIATYELDLLGPGDELAIPSQNHHLVLVETGDEIDLHHKRDALTAASDPSKVDLFVVHGAGDIGSTDIRLVDPQNNTTVLETLFDNLEPDSVTDYISVSPGIHAFELSSSDNSLVHDVVLVDLSNLAGKAISGVIVPAGSTAGASATLVLSGATTPVGILKDFADNGDGVISFTTYPNPFSSSVHIGYELGSAMELEIRIYNASGQKVRALYSGLQQQGAYQVHWDGNNEHGQIVEPGMYFCTMTSGSGTITRRISKIR